MDFVNAREQASKNPKTFFLPLQEDFDKLDKGDYVKVCLNGERFWCEVVDLSKEEESIVGAVSNELVLNDFDPGTELTIKYEHVYDIINK